MCPFSARQGGCKTESLKHVLQGPATGNEAGRPRCGGALSRTVSSSSTFVEGKEAHTFAPLLFSPRSVVARISEAQRTIATTRNKPTQLPQSEPFQ